jgi:hypothetical protein
MTERDRHLLALRYLEIEAELQGIAEGRVVDGDPGTIEGGLLDELGRIEYQLGDDYLTRRGE